MRTEQVEIYSDTSNMAILRHPGRSFPGVLIQGDTLNEMLTQSARIVTAGKEPLSEEARDDLLELHEHLGELVARYRRVLLEHGFQLPFAA